MFPSRIPRDSVRDMSEKCRGRQRAYILLLLAPRRSDEVFFLTRCAELPNKLASSATCPLAVLAARRKSREIAQERSPFPLRVAGLIYFA